MPGKGESESLNWQQWCVESMLMIKKRQRGFAMVLSLNPAAVQLFSKKCNVLDKVSD